MKKFTTDELKTILDAHDKRQRGEDGGADADLADADLAGANLAHADLAGANLARANLAHANLAGANLAGADLTDADLTDANLAHANLTRANLTDADLTDAYLADADLTDADLTGAYLADADLTGAYLADAGNLPTGVAAVDRAVRYRERHPGVPVVEDLDRKILDAITAGGGALDMTRWHSCETTHCRAGWAIHLAGAAGYELEKQYNSRVAGAMIYRASTGTAPHFFDTTARALEDIRRCAEAST